MNRHWSRTAAVTMPSGGDPTASLVRAATTIGAGRITQFGGRHDSGQDHAHLITK